MIHLVQRAANRLHRRTTVTANAPARGRGWNRSRGRTLCDRTLAALRDWSAPACCTAIPQTVRLPPIHGTRYAVPRDKSTHTNGKKAVTQERHKTRLIFRLVRYLSIKYFRSFNGMSLNFCWYIRFEISIHHAKIRDRMPRNPYKTTTAKDPRYTVNYITIHTHHITLHHIAFIIAHS